MTDQKEPIQAQATRSFGDYIQGCWYAIDPNDGQLMSLLGAGYFDTKGNDNLTRERFSYEAGEVVAANAPQQHVMVEEGVDGQVGTEPRGDSARGKRSRSRTREQGDAGNA